MQPVELVERHQVDQPLDLVDAVEVPGDVEHRAAPGEARAVVDRPEPDPPWPGLPHVRLDSGGQQLPDRLHAPEQPRRTRRRERDGVTGYDQPVPLLAERPVTGGEREHDAPVGAASAHR